MIVYLLFCICISLSQQTGQAVFLLESPRKAFGQMETGQLETTEFKTINTHNKLKQTMPVPIRHVTNSAQDPASLTHRANHRALIANKTTTRNMDNFPGWGQIGSLLGHVMSHCVIV